MNSRLLLPLATLLVGLGLGWGVQALLNPPSELVSLKTQVVELEKKNSEQKESLEAAEKNLTAANQNKTALQIELTHEKEKSAEIAKTVSEAKPKPSPFEDMMRQGMETHLNTRIDSLTLALKLTPDQITRLKQAIQNAKNAQSSNPNANPMMAMGTTTAAMNKELETLLTPEQKIAYEDFKTRERTAQMETAANVEVSQIQTMLNLTPEQTDQAFTKFVDLNNNQGKNPPNSTDPAAFLEQAMERKKEALRDVLNPDQFKIYEQMLTRQKEMALKMMPALKQSMAPAP